MPRDEAHDWMMEYQDYFFSYVDGPKCINFGIKELTFVEKEPGNPMVLERGMTYQIPFACLLEIDQSFEFKDSKNFARSAFLRTVNLSPGDNIFNRIGVMAIGAQEKRMPRDVEINQENWKEFVDFDRMRRVAEKIG